MQAAGPIHEGVCSPGFSLFGSPQPATTREQAKAWTTNAFMNWPGASGAVNNLGLHPGAEGAMLSLRDEHLSSKYRREIIVPGLGLLLEQSPLADRPISLSARRAFLLFPRSVANARRSEGIQDFTFPSCRAGGARCFRRLLGDRKTGRTKLAVSLLLAGGSGHCPPGAPASLPALPGTGAK